MNTPATPSQCIRCGAAVESDARFCRACGQPVTAPAREAADPLIGATLLGRYLVVRPIGQGGMGRVYVGEQRVGRSTRAVAIKVLAPMLSGDPVVVERFHREAATILQLSHPSTVQLLDFGEQGGRLFLVMEHVAGERLAEVIARGPVPLQRAVAIAVQIAGSLDEAHRKGVVHRDLKPENVILTGEGTSESPRVKVVDFGVAKHIEATDQSPALTARGTLVGTPAYMSPEQFVGLPVDARSDVYALGLLTYCMLAGQLPWQAKNVYEWATRHVKDPVPPLADRAPGLPAHVYAAVEQALAKSPSDRPESTAAFARALAGVTPGEDPWVAMDTRDLAHAAATRPAPALTPTAPGAATLAARVPVPRATPWKVFAALFLVAIGAGFGTVVYVQRTRDRGNGTPGAGDGSTTTRASRTADVAAHGDAATRDASASDGAADPGVIHPNWPRAQQALLDGLDHAARRDLEGALRGVETAQDLIGPTSIKLAGLREQVSTLGAAAIRADLAAGHCSAAQTKARRLRRVGAEGEAYRLFGRRCAAP
ncbi:MAG: serine/threonine-protein kinase [Deltaproteobacteria bacterium]